MGYDATAYTVLGVKLDDNVFRVRDKKRGCKHIVSDSEFCPECGEPMWEKIWDWMDVYNSLMGNDGPYRIIYGNCEDSVICVGVVLGEEDTYREDINFCDNIDNFDQVKENLFKMLKKYNIEFDEKTFGIWTVLSES